MIGKPPTLGDIISAYQYQQAKRSLADKFARVMADCKREDEREDAARAVGGIHERGSDRWCEVRDEESGPDDDGKFDHLRQEEP